MQLLLLLLAPLIAADLGSPKSCPLNSMSCSSPSSDSCCSPKYGQVVLELQWLPGYGPATAFTMHGLWPNTCSGGMGPANGCDDNRQYDDVQGYLDSSLLDDMNTYWPSNKNDNNAFWVHEWQKHGTCVTTLFPSCFDSDSYQTGDEVSVYFRSALALRQQYDLYAAMKDAGFGAVRSVSQGYNAEDVVAAIRRKFGVTVALECKGSMINGARMYFGVRGRDTYVPQNASGGQKCRGKVFLPLKSMSRKQLEEFAGEPGMEEEN